MERVATTKINHDVEALTLDLRQYVHYFLVKLRIRFQVTTLILNRKLGFLNLQRVNDGKRIPLHKFEISCLANFIKDVSYCSVYHDT